MWSLIAKIKRAASTSRAILAGIRKRSRGVPHGAGAVAVILFLAPAHIGSADGQNIGDFWSHQREREQISDGRAGSVSKGGESLEQRDLGAYRLNDTVHAGQRGTFAEVRGRCIYVEKTNGNDVFVPFGTSGDFDAWLSAGNDGRGFDWQNCCVPRSVSCGPIVGDLPYGLSGMSGFDTEAEEREETTTAGDGTVTTTRYVTTWRTDFSCTPSAAVLAWSTACSSTVNSYVTSVASPPPPSTDCANSTYAANNPIECGRLTQRVCPAGYSLAIGRAGFRPDSESGANEGQAVVCQNSSGVFADIEGCPMGTDAAFRGQFANADGVAAVRYCNYNGAFDTADDEFSWMAADRGLWSNCDAEGNPYCGRPQISSIPGGYEFLYMANCFDPSRAEYSTSPCSSARANWPSYYP